MLAFSNETVKDLIRTYEFKYAMLCQAFVVRSVQLIGASRASSNFDCLFGRWGAWACSRHLVEELTHYQSDLYRQDALLEHQPQPCAARPRPETAVRAFSRMINPGCPDVWRFTDYDFGNALIKGDL